MVMKQFTTPEQTAKLIVLGFEKPKSRVDGEMEEILKVIVPLGEFKIPIINNCPAYSIGELIEMLGVKLSSIYYIGIEWFVNADGLERRSEELIDALYNMIIKLKEEGVI